MYWLKIAPKAQWLAVLSVVFCLGVSSVAVGQLSVVSLSPVHGSTTVPTTVTIEIQFNAPLDTSARFSEPGDHFLGLLPMERNFANELDSITVSADLKTVQYHNVELEPNTKYIFGVMAARGQEGESLDLPAVTTFTTGDTLPSASISGKVSFAAG